MNSNKPVEADNVPTSTAGSFSRGQVAHDDIARHAADLWRARGYPSGQDTAIWLEAEAELKAKAEAAPVSGTPSRPYVDEPGTRTRSGTKGKDAAESAAQTRSPTEARARTAAGKLRNQ